LLPHADLRQIAMLIGMYITSAAVILNGTLISGDSNINLVYGGSGLPETGLPLSEMAGFYDS